ncbi:hypothetical protein QY702_22370 [Xanthomonas campestris pv. plantaginis]|uniref:hypothetical protein n=1 Tax=Xanthomonas campestris TaxID=339 RepID=UPI002B237145|nr:hypothetical protein [Xanthomonas campestris]MEA9609087.1 hypothetical protein [Xanthomonas campestris pv. plantaginis]
MREPDILLSVEEQYLFAEIRFDWKSDEELRSSLAPMEQLASSILGRNAVPEVRLSYFSEPEFNPTGRGKSRQDVFEKNGTSGGEILAHPSFLKHLEYFICGPDLPNVAIEKFKSEASSSHLSGSDIVDLGPYARSCVRQYRLDPHHASEEFFKLAVECGAMPGFADNLRKSVRSVKLT